MIVLDSFIGVPISVAAKYLTRGLLDPN